jgi:hypothetical protein
MSVTEFINKVSQSMITSFDFSVCKSRGSELKTTTNLSLKKKKKRKQL